MTDTSVTPQGRSQKWCVRGSHIPRTQQGEPQQRTAEADRTSAPGKPGARGTGLREELDDRREHGSHCQNGTMWPHFCDRHGRGRVRTPVGLVLLFLPKHFAPVLPRVARELGYTYLYKCMTSRSELVKFSELESSKGWRGGGGWGGATHLKWCWKNAF